MICSSDSDFGVLAQRLRDYGKRVVGIPARWAASHILVKQCHEFIFVEIAILGALVVSCGDAASISRKVALADALAASVRADAGPASRPRPMDRPDRVESPAPAKAPARVTLYRLRRRMIAFLHSQPRPEAGNKLLGRIPRYHWLLRLAYRDGLLQVELYRTGDSGLLRAWVRARFLEPFTPPLMIPRTHAAPLPVLALPGSAKRVGHLPLPQVSRAPHRRKPQRGYIAVIGRATDGTGRGWYRIRYRGEGALREGFVPASALRAPVRVLPPRRIRGLYLGYYTTTNVPRYRSLLDRAAALGINTLVVDVQPHYPPSAFLRYARALRMYLVARVVVFPRGLKRYPAPERRLARVLRRVRGAVRRGFAEVQLDYLRFSDRDYATIHKVSVEERTSAIARILERLAAEVYLHGGRASADVFGRIPFRTQDRTGQSLPVFARYLDVIYPMLYPSHFYGNPDRISNPYRTVYEGVQASLKRAKGRARIVTFVQGFNRKVPAGMTLTEYVKLQLRAVREAGGHGFVAWHPTSHYEPTFQALTQLR